MSNSRKPIMFLMSAAHEPFGGIQMTWGVSTYDPELKFSGKPRDAESELDYFGARYYDRAQYRFINVDPIIPKWTSAGFLGRNLYNYCWNNPISFSIHQEDGLIAFIMAGPSQSD